MQRFFWVWLTIRKFAELEKVFKAEDQKAWEGSTGLKGEESNEVYGSFSLCATSSMHFC